MGATELAKLLTERVEDLCRELLPNGERKGNSWVIGNIDGDAGKSMKVGLSGERLGQWNDFGNMDMSGDLIGLIKAVKRYTTRQAWEYACDFLRIPRGQAGKIGKPKQYYRPKPISDVIPDEPLKYLTEERKISPETLKLFRIYGDKDKMCFPCYIGDNCYCITNISIYRDKKDKKICTQENDKNPDESKRLDVEYILFGWQIMTGDEREVIICEGQIDSMSWYEYGYKALSVPAGANNLEKWIENDFDRLAVFDTIYINMDGDDTGKIAAASIIKKLGAERCKIINLSFKDINECLQRNFPKSTIDEFVGNASFCDPPDIKRPNDYRDKVWDYYYPPKGTFLGISPPWRKAHSIIKFRPAELSIWLGYSGSGKSQMLGQVLLSTIEQGKQVCIASMEMIPENFLYKLTRQASAGELKPNRGYYDSVLDILHNNVFIFERTGTAKRERLLASFEYVYKRYGVDQFLIDSLMKLDIAEDDYNSQKSFIEQLCDFKNKFKVHVHLITHSRKRMNESEAPSKMDAKGTGAITDLADNVFVVWRNKRKEVLIEKEMAKEMLTAGEMKELQTLRHDADTFWKCEKQRNGDYEGTIRLYFHRQSFQFTEYEKAPPKKYIDESNAY
jgi:twinkle protein